MVVVGAMFMTAEYRRRLIHITLTATPRRGRALAAKAVVTGVVTFVAGLLSAAIAVVSASGSCAATACTCTRRAR